MSHGVFFVCVIDLWQEDMLRVHESAIPARIG